MIHHIRSSLFFPINIQILEVFFALPKECSIEISTNFYMFQITNSINNLMNIYIFCFKYNLPVKNSNE